MWKQLLKEEGIKTIQVKKENFSVRWQEKNPERISEFNMWEKPKTQIDLAF